MPTENKNNFFRISTVLWALKQRGDL